MSGSPTFQGLTRETLEEHRQIHFYLDQIAQTLQALTPDLDTVEPMRRLAAQLEGLEERLVEHHETEEEGGLFRAILEVLPACRVEIDRLTVQHAKMIEILEIARLHAQGGQPADAPALREDLERFLDAFRQHEQDEELLLAQASEKESASLDDGSDR
jgi:hypothetical protein